jgi:hypothetical protein
MFSDKGFAGGMNAVPYSGSAAAAIVGISTAATVAGEKRAVNSTGQPTSVIDNLPRQDWINVIANEPIVCAR